MIAILVLWLLKLCDSIYLDNALFIYYIYSDSFPSTFNTFFLKKYISMKPDWPLRSLTIYLKPGPTTENLISVSAVLNFGILFQTILNQRVVLVSKSS